MNYPASIIFPLTLLVLFHSPVYAGFPSPATDYEQGPINLNKYLISNENTTYLFRVRGESMSGIGIYDGDTLIVDRSIAPKHNDIVLAVVDEEFTVKRLYHRGQEIKLIAENPSFAPIELKDGQELRIWGVVTFNLHKLTNNV
jgi:DNA polymerase V